MRPKLIALIAVSAIALVGCSAGGQNAEDASDKPNASPSTEPAPLIMTEEQAKDEASPTPTAESSETDFITFMQPDFSGWKGDFPADKDLIAAGYLACEKLDSGVPEMEVEVIPDSLDDPTSSLFRNNRIVVNSAIGALCKQHLPG